MEQKQIPPSYFSHRDNLISRLEDMTEEQAHLNGQLRKSLCIEDIWTDAFKYGSCRFSGTQKEGAVKGRLARQLCFFEAWFINGYERRWLTAGELIAFKPDAYVHQDYRVPTELVERL